MTVLVGLIALYVWIHGAIVLFTKTENLTQYEKVLLIAGGILFILSIIGFASNN